MSSEIVFIAGKDPYRQQGGHSSYVRSHARAAMALGFRPHIFFVGSENATRECAFGVLHEVASWARPLRPIVLPLHGPRLVGAVTSFLEMKPGPHLLHSFGFWFGIGSEVRGRLSARGCRAAHITSAYSTLRHEYLAKLRGALGGVSLLAKGVQSVEFAVVHYLRGRYERPHLLQSDAVLVNYDSVSRIIASEYGPNIQCRKMPYCSETAFLTGVEGPAPEGLRAFKAPEAPLIVAVARHDPRKGIVHLLEAFAQLRDSGLPFRACLVGGGPLVEAHRRFARKLGLEGFVAIEGWVPDPFAYLKAADIFALPSIEEGSGSVAVLEALQAGLPIVASNIDGIPEDVSESEAILVEPGNSKAIADALRRLLLDTELRSRLAAAARKRYEAAFSADVLTTSLGRVYAEFGFEKNL
ncbi:MAG: glycosyltransferase family 4 protein [Acidobacteriota bacterium]